MHDYTLYRGDLAFAGAYLPHLTRLLDGWYASVTNGRGLLEKEVGKGGEGWGDYASLPRGGKVAYYNANYVRALRAAAALAMALGGSDRAAARRARADQVAVMRQAGRRRRR